MSRSGYTDDCENVGLWRGAVKRATRGYDGQALLVKLRDALDAMPVKRLITDAIRNEDGEVCALGAIDPNFTGYEAEELAEHFHIARALAAEIVYMNDEYPTSWWDGNTRHDETPEQRWTRMRTWVEHQIMKPADDAALPVPHKEKSEK